MASSAASAARPWAVMRTQVRGRAAGVALLHFDHACLFQHGEVLGQVAGSQAEGLAQVAEFGALRLGGDREDAEPVPLVHGLIDAVSRVL